MLGAYIQEGVSPAGGVIIAACTVGDDYDKPKNRIGVRRHGAWLDFGTSGEAVVSVDATGNSLGYVLGTNGTVISFDWRGSDSVEQLRSSRRLMPNPEALAAGPLRRIRVLGKDAICSGSVGQCYRLNRDRFDRLPDLLVERQGATIEDIAGADGVWSFADQTIGVITNGAWTTITTWSAESSI
jgi:hypothetical protein